MYPILLLVVRNLVIVATAQGAYDDPSHLLVDVNDGNVREVIASSQYFFLDFYVSRKGSTIPLDGVMSKSSFTVAERLGHHTQLKFGKIETKNSPVISKEVGVQETTYATKVLFKDGKVVDIINSRSIDLYMPDMLYNWLLKRVQGPILLQQVPTLSESQAAVLTLTATPSPRLAAASLNLTEVMFYQQPGRVEFGGKVLLEGSTYVVRNFLGESSVEPLDESRYSAPEELLEQIRKLTTPLVERLTISVLNKVYMKQQWTLGLFVTTPKSKHKATLDMFIASVNGLKEMVPDPQQLQGVYVENDDTTERDGPFTLYQRLVNRFEMSDVEEGGIRVFLFKDNGSKKDAVQAKMNTELTQHNIKSFFFEEVQNNLLDESMAKKRKETKRSELPPPNWKEKTIKPIVKRTLQEWVTDSKAEVLILVCHGTPSRTLTKTLLTLNKLQKRFNGRIEFGKINTGLNEMEDIAVPDEGFVRVKMDGSGKISSEIISRGTLDDDPLVGYLLSNLQSNKDEL